MHGAVARALGSGRRCWGCGTALRGAVWPAGQELGLQLEPRCRQQAGCLPVWDTVWRVAFSGQVGVQGLGVHVPLMVALPVTHLPAQVEGRQAGAVFDKIQQKKEKGGGPLSASVYSHATLFSLWPRDKDSRCLPRLSGS